MSYRNKKTNKRVLYDHHMGLLVSYMTKHIGSLGPQCTFLPTYSFALTIVHAMASKYFLLNAYVLLGHETDG